MSETPRRARGGVHCAAALIALGLAGAGPAAAEDAADRRANLDYMAHCEGCHKADGSGLEDSVPTLAGELGKFLATQEGREYLVRVPGTAQALLDDEAVARVLNWMLRRFDPEHTPADFRPYEAAEVARLRREPFSRASFERERIIANLPAATASAANTVAAVAPPAGRDAYDDFCALCHPASADGGHGQGPNLQGVLGRVAGSAPGFSYSAAMKRYGLPWSRENLLAYVENPSALVHNTTMVAEGMPWPEAAELEEIVRFLEALSPPPQP